MNCRRVRSVISAYIDGELTGYEMFILRDHLSGCRECRDEHYSLKTIKYLVSALPEKEPNSEWASLLAQTIAKPSPSLADRLRMQWSRSIDSAVPRSSAEGVRKGLPVNGQRLAWALMACAFSAFLMASPFNQSAPPYPADTGARASLISVPSPLPQSTSLPADTAGVTHLIAIPLAPESLAGSPAAAFPVRPITITSERSGLREANDLHVLSQGPGLNAFPISWPSQRTAAPRAIHATVTLQPEPLGPGR